MSKQKQNDSDEALLLRLADGEATALDQLFARHASRIKSYCLRRGLSPERCDDILQIVFLQIYRKKHLYDPRHQALAWIYVITRSELKDYRNREIKDFSEWSDSVSQNSLSQNPEFAPKIEAKDEAHSLLKELGDREQEVMSLRYLEELEYEEIAQRLKESEANIRQIVSRSLRYLRNLKRRT